MTERCGNTATALSQDDRNAMGMTIGDFMHNMGLSQEVYELRHDVGLIARRELERARIKEDAVLRLVNGKRAEIRKIKERVRDLDIEGLVVKEGRAEWRKGFNPGNLLTKLIDRLRNERIRLQNDPEYLQLENDLKVLRAVIVRAQVNMGLAPHEDKSLKDGGKIRRW